MTGARGPRLYREQGIVLRSIKLGEADRILTLYTSGSGRVRAVAKGVRKMKSRFGARLDAFTHVDVMLYRGRDLDVINQAEIVAHLPRLREHYPTFCAAAAMADAVERSTPERERNARLFVLLRGGLRALDAGVSDPGLVAYAFLAKVSALAGLEPHIDACVGCGSGERVGFSHAQGGAVCPRCATSQDTRASEQGLQAWTFLQEGEWDALATARMEAPLRREVSGLVLDFAQWQLDNRFRAFALLGAP